jgi:polar amino acid transport system substrate-binding protein
MVRASDLSVSRFSLLVVFLRAPTGNEAIAMFERDALEVAAGVKSPLLRYAQPRPDLRVMDGRFMAIEQAIGVPKGRSLAVSYLRTMIEELKASGFVADALARSAQRDARVAPAA